MGDAPSLGDVEIEYGKQLFARLLRHGIAPGAEGNQELPCPVKGHVAVHHARDVKDVAFFTTLAGYIHWQLSGEKVLGVGEASGMFPIDSEACDFDARMIEQFDELVADRNLGWKLRDIMPKVLCAGQTAGWLTEEGAKLLDM